MTGLLITKLCQSTSYTRKSKDQGKLNWSTR